MNLDLQYYANSFHFVLIDTWWNVNKILVRHDPQPSGVLIDTWWNVNEIEKDYMNRAEGFNRYMVECEYGTEDFTAVKELRF